VTGAEPLPLADDFERAARRGRAVGATTRSGHRRGGVDAEGVVAVDAGGARLGALARPGWGRAGVAYGPWPTSAGLAFAIHLVNGHNAAQDQPRRSRPRLLARWLLGSGTDAPLGRLPGLLQHTDRESRRHRLRRYLLLDRTHPPDALDPVNLALGWFGAEAPPGPDREPGVVTVAGAAEDSGVMAVVGPAGPVAVRERLGELPLRLVAVTGDGAVVLYLAVGVDDGRPPRLEPVALVRCAPIDLRWAGLHQRVMGEIGFALDTRVYDARVACIEPWAHWWTTALAADRLTGDGPLDDPSAATGQAWELRAGKLERTLRGLVAASGEPALAVLEAGGPIGLLHAVVGRPVESTSNRRHPTADRSGTASAEPEAVLHWRWRSPDTSWRLRLGRANAVVEQVEAGTVNGRWAAALPAAHAEQGDRTDLDVVVVDDGRRIRVVIDGQPVLAVIEVADGAGPAEQEENEATALAVGPLGPEWAVRDLEAHPRALDLPGELCTAPRSLSPGAALAWSEHFAYPLGDLAGHSGPAGTWQRTLGRDHFVVTESGHLAVRAERASPAHGRTLYTVDWDDPGFADLAVTVRPPGTRRGEGHRGRGGLVLWQDESTYLVVNTWLDDGFAGSSVSVFPHLGGFEDVFDAVWVNVGERIRWGVPYRLRLVCDGEALLIYTEGAQVLYRALADVTPSQPRLSIRRVGLAVNWEWGTDTGTTFSDLEARRR
jgi:hypothetical protein